MSKDKFTKGKWINDGTYIHARQASGHLIMVAEIRGFGRSGDVYAEIQANGNLMAAAPDLYEACEAAYASLGFPLDDESLTNVTNKLANALEKARRGGKA